MQRDAKLGDTGINHTAVLGQLDRILASPQFVHADRQRALLRFLVENALGDERMPLKESVIAAEVYGSAAYDPKVDSSVRVDIGRLRHRLREFYGANGEGATVSIAIPKGSYTPQFEPLQPPPGTLVGREMTAPKLSRRSFIPLAGGLCLGAAAFSWKTLSHSPPSVSVNGVGRDGTALDAQRLASAFWRRHFRVQPAWDESVRPHVRVIVGATRGDDRRYVAVLGYSRLYEYPAGATVLKLAGAAWLPDQSEAVAIEAERAWRGVENRGSLSRDRSASVDVSRGIWRELSGRPDYSIDQDDRVLPVARLLELCASLERATARDDGFAGAHAQLAWVYRLAADRDMALYARARAESDRALSLDPQLGLAHFVAGYIRFFSDWQFREALDHLRTALRRNPLRSQWYRYATDAAMLLGEYDEAEDGIRQGTALLPGVPALAILRVRLAGLRGDFTEMERRAKETLAAHPGLAAAQVQLGKALEWQGRYNDAESLYLASSRGALGSARALAAVARIRARRGDRKAAEELLRRPAFARMPSVAGAVRVLMGDLARADEEFARAWRDRDPNLPYLLVEPEPLLNSHPFVIWAVRQLGLRRAVPRSASG